MEYSKAKRALSVIASILGLVFVIGAVAVVALGVSKLIGGEKVAIGQSLGDLSDLINWLIYVVVFVLAYIDIMLILGLLKKPMLINGKYKSVGWYKVFFAILTAILGFAVAIEFFSKYGFKENNILKIIVIVLALAVAIAQIVSMFLSVEPKEENPELLEEPVEEEVVNSPDTAVAVKGSQPLSVFNTVASDPVADGFEQRIREIKHLREAGLINDAQTASAIDKIIYGITRITK